MSVILIKEGTVLALADWPERMCTSSEDIKHLVDVRVLRPTDSGHYGLVFVGVVIFKDSLLFVQPKFGSLDLPETLRILRSYFARSRQRRPISDSTRDPEFGDGEILREFDALIGLKDWFFAHGLYRREQAVASDWGRPHWIRTIAKSPALIMQGAVVYPSIVAERREGILNDVSALQIGVLLQLLRRYGFAVPGAIRQAEIATGTAVRSWPLERDERVYYERQLAAERRSVYRTDTLRLFKLLHEVLDTRLAAPSAQPQIYGTTAFYAIWEDACCTGIGGDLPTGFHAALGQPIWWTYDDAGRKQRHGQTQIPDLVVRRDRWLLIIDAKYYFPFPGSRPGGPDIIKQVYYAESLQHPQANLISIFLFPLPGAETPRFLGYATIEGSHRAFNIVEAWGVDPVALLATYPVISADRANRMIDVIVGRREGVSEFVSQSPVDIGS
ncbi:LlaJI family restriction endonuclease [Janthinobacterium aquaticum]|uniref:LlaJI family restriction endonuclease n=1 Tax=Janthinobacterium sp. FT58W TaxID=2654254 RepID=UPI0012657907|nr:LlaJI family restriction endonuclease [Janthinobacterium sp. FT58W]KAB8040187.1 LlaJI family restriction endonuclease [Janthinobacterium sp. FT58W]